jgi:penicillin-binding protein 1A
VIVRHPRRRLGVALVGFGALFGALALVAGAVVVHAAPKVELGVEDPEPLAEAAARPLSQPSVVVDAAGHEIASFRPEQLHVSIEPDAVPHNVQVAVVAAEDRDFFRHHGFDLKAIARAAVADLRHDEVVQGGSTITQQLVKNLYTNKARTLRRKLDELATARDLEAKYSKREILAAYLNTVYFGEGAVGIEAAARTYFHKPSSRLTLGEAALLAGLIPAPSVYDPRRNPPTAEARRQVVLDRVARAGTASAADVERAREEHPHVFPPAAATATHPYFVDYVRRWLVNVAHLDPQLITGGGLRIETTLDPKAQEAAEHAIDAHLPDRAGPTGAAVVIDPGTGFVRALVGGRNWERSKVNLALGRLGGGSGRQPGSSFKAFVLAKAYESGMKPSDVIPAPRTYTPEGYSTPVGNYEGQGYGSMSLLDATKHSVNTAYVQLTEKLGPMAVRELAARLGIEGLPAWVGPSIGIGAYETSPLEMATAYGAFASDGLKVDPTPVVRVIDAHGKVLVDRRTPAPRPRVLDANVAHLVDATLRQVIESGTGTAADIGRPAAGKTGTSDQLQNAWFVGYTPQLVTAVWVGYPQGNVPMTDVPGVGHVTGGSIPARIWRDVMLAALDGVPPADFPPADLGTPRSSTSHHSSSSRSPGETRTKPSKGGKKKH